MSRSKIAFYLLALIPAMLAVAGIKADGVLIYPSVTKTQNGIRLEWKTGSPVLDSAFLAEDGVREGTVRLTGWGSTSETGKPELPVLAFPVAVPPGKAYRFEILTLRYRDIQGVRPLPSPFAEFESGGGFAGGAEEGGARAVRIKDPKAYSEDAFYPARPVKLHEGLEFRGVPYVMVEVTPVAANTARNMLRHYDDIVVEFTFEEGPRTAPGVQGASSMPSDSPFLGTFDRFLNPDDARRFRLPGPPQVRRQAALTGPGMFSLDPPLHQDPNAWQLKISQTGLYRLTYSYLSANTTLPLATLDPRNFKIYLKGEEIPIYVAGESDGVFGASDYLEFYGLKNEDTESGVWNRGDYTDTNLYWLRVESTPGLRVASRSVAPVNGYSTAADFTDTIHYEKDYEPAMVGVSNRLTGLLIGPPAFTGQDRWFWMGLITASGKSTENEIIAMTVPSPSAAAGTATVTAQVFSAVDSSTVNPDGRAVIRWNGSLIQDYSWDGRTFATLQGTTNQSNVKSGSNNFRIEVPQITGITNVIHLNWAELTYKRLFQASSNELTFSYGPGNARFAVSQFGAGGIAAYDVTSAGAPVLLTGGTVSGGGPYTLTFEDSVASGTRRYALASTLRTPDSISANATSDLKNAVNGADWIAIADDTFYNDAALDALVAHRQSQGLRTAKVRLQDVYDEFNNGVMHPRAIRDFLSWAYSNWQAPSPAFVVLVGEASLDYKNVEQKTPYYNHVPATMMDTSATALGYYAWEARYVTFSDDPYAIPGMAWGRLSVRDSAELQGFVDRLVSYDTAPPAGSWRGKALMISDRVACLGTADCDSNPSANQECIFELAHNAAAVGIQPAYSYQKIYYGRAPYYGCNTNVASSENGCYSNGNCSKSTANVTTDIVSAIDNGAAVLTFIGHGSWEIWRDKTMSRTTPDTWSLLSNSGKIPFQVNGNCYTGGFYHQDLTESFGERSVRLGSQRGSLAFYAPGAIAMGQTGYDSIISIYDQIYGRYKRRNLGAIIVNHQQRLIQQALLYEQQTHAMLGDPASSLVTPAPKPPASLWVDSVGNNTVNLAWTASPDAGVTGYHVYRCQFNCSTPSGSFTRLTGSPVAGLTYSDTTAVNLQTFTYYVTSVDSDGYEGPSSNTVDATPCNPNPPAPPVILSLSDPAMGRRLVIQWQPNAEGDIYSYTIHYGNAPGAYTRSATVYASTGITSYVLETLGYDGTPWYAAMTATNTCGQTSAYSAEWSLIPTADASAFRPPQMVNLMVGLRNGNPLLSWAAPAADLYGGPVTLDRFAVYRSLAGPNFSPDRNPVSPDRLAVITFIPGQTEYEYEDVSSGAGDAWYYVTAYSGENEESSTGRAHPVAVYNIFTQTYYYDDVIDMWWDAPNPLVDFSGKATSLVKYRVYASTDPSFQPDRYAGSNRMYETVLSMARCCPDYFGEMCSFVRNDCDLLTFRVTIVDPKNNEGMH